jgi:hypothetical protein
MHFIESMQRILKAAWRHTSRRADAAAQVLQRIGVLRWINNRLSSIGIDISPVAALHEDRETQAYLTGILQPIPGVNTFFTQPENAEQYAFNSAYQNALVDLNHPALPVGHLGHASRLYPRRGGTFVRKGITAVSIGVLPLACKENLSGSPVLAIFSTFDPAVAAQPGGVVAAAPVAEPEIARESAHLRFIVDFWFSYDATGLTPETPNAISRRRLKVSELNLSPDSDSDADQPLNVIDLAAGRWVAVQPSITASGDTTRENVAAYVFQRVKASAKRQILDIGELCQPLWVLPFLRNVDGAKEFFDSKESKWSADQWLVCKKLY